MANEIVRQHRSKVDVMIALSHLGKGADTYLARQVPGLDFVIGGHSEDVIQKPIRVPRPDGSSALVMQAGRYGELVGRADVSVDLKRGRVSVAQYRLLPIDQSAPADENVERVVGEVEAEFTPNLHVRYKTLHVPTNLRGEFKRLLLDEMAILKDTTRHIYLAKDEVHEDADREDISAVVLDTLQMIVDALSQDGDVSLSEIADKTERSIPSAANAA